MAKAWHAFDYEPTGWCVTLSDRKPRGNPGFYILAESAGEALAKAESIWPGAVERVAPWVE